MRILKKLFGEKRVTGSDNDADSGNSPLIPSSDENPEKEDCVPIDDNSRTSHNQAPSMFESLFEVQRMIGDIQYNVSLLVQNQASAADVAAMRRENEAFRADSNMKLMRKYGIDAMIKTYQAICDKLFRINHPLSGNSFTDSDKVPYEWVLNRIERQFKQLGIRLRTSEPGIEIDEMTMEVYDGEDVDEEDVIFETNDSCLQGTVKESVCPAFFWTIPSLIGDTKEWCMEAEKVCIYK